MPARIVDMTRGLHGRLKQFFDTPIDASSTPLEIGLAVLDDIEERVQPVGGGRRAFPYTSVAIRVLAAESDRAPIDAALQGLEPRVRERLAELRCDPPPALAIGIVWADERPAGWNARARSSRSNTGARH